MSQFELLPQTPKGALIAALKAHLGGWGEVNGGKIN